MTRFAYATERCDRERGSAAVELVLVAPLLVLVLLTVVAFGRLVDARLVVADAAHQAARAASGARTEEQARVQALRVVREALRNSGPGCTRPQVRIDTGRLAPGARTMATVSCTADLGGLTRTGLPGHMILTGTAFSAIDTYRSSP